MGGQRVQLVESLTSLTILASARRGKRFFLMCIKLAGAGVTLDRRVELPSVEHFEPRAKPRKSL